MDTPPVVIDPAAYGSTPSATPPPSGPLPRLLCLHGGGTSQRIFHLQTVRLQRQLKNHFRFVFVNAPFESEPGPGVSPFFDEMGPFYRWTRRKPDETGEQVTAALERGIRGEGDDHLMGIYSRKDDTDGPVVGVLGFSQGSMVGSGLLLQQQRQTAAGEPGYGLRFGVFCMSGYPILHPSTGTVTEPEPASREWESEYEGIITLPSVHVLGLQDQYLENGRRLYRCCDPSTAKLMEMDLEHRLPISDQDNEKLASAILDLYYQTAPGWKRGSVTAAA